MFLTMSQLGDTLKGVVAISRGSVRVLHSRQVQGPLITQLIQTATQHEQIEMRGTARWLLKMLSPHFEVHLHSLSALSSPTLLPNIDFKRNFTETGQRVFRSAKRQKISRLMISHRPGENPKKDQSLASFSAVMMGAAIQAEYQGTLFLTAILPSVTEAEFCEETNKVLEKIRQQIQMAGLAGFFQFKLKAPSSLLNEIPHTVKIQTTPSDAISIVMNPDFGEGESGFSEADDASLDRYFIEKNTDKTTAHSLPAPVDIHFSLKSEIALAGAESDQAQHHRLFTSKC